MTSGVPEAFGFVPAGVVADLQDIGNWKSRATAIDVLHKCLKDVAKPALLVPSLGDFVKFLVGLIADPNFKIAISSMSILGDLAAKVGNELEPHLKVVVPALMDKFTDSKILVRSANMKVVRRLMLACTPAVVLELLASGCSHPSWRVREEVLNTHIMAMLSFAASSYDANVMYQLLSSCLSDGKDRVRMVALEGLAVLNSRIGGSELEALTSGQRAGCEALPEALRSQLAARLENPALPGINADGIVEHVMEAPSTDNPDIRLADAAFGGVPGVKMSWGEVNTPARPRPRAATTPDVMHGPAMIRTAHAPMGLDYNNRQGSDPLPGSRRDALLHVDGGRAASVVGVQHSGLQAEDSGSWSPAHRAASMQPYMHPPSRLGSHESASGGGAPITAAPVVSSTGWSAAQHPNANSLHGARLAERSGSPAREVPQPGHGTVSPLPMEVLHDRSSSGAHGHSAGLQPLKHHWGARQETFSPSKAEMLARLKNRQIEKRVATAQQMDATFGHSGSGDLALAQNDIAVPSHSFSVAQPPRRYLFTQLSDSQRDRGAERPDPSRGYNSVLNTPTRAQGSASPFDETPPSAQPQSHRPPRAGLGPRLARATPLAVEAGGSPGTSPNTTAAGGAAGVLQTRSPTLNSTGMHQSPPPSEESPARNPSPALTRLRTRSADPNPNNPYPPTPGGGGGGPGGMPPTPTGNGPGGAFWEKGRVGDVLPTDELTPIPDPDKHIKVVIARLVEANHADRKELDWQGQFDALMDARRLVKHHPEVVRACLHDFVRAATPAIDQLRSQTSKCALALFQDCFSLLGRTMDRELDEMVPVLLKKAGEVSNAGRDNFLSAEADRVLGEMYRCCGEARSVLALLGCAGHKNPYVRGKVAFHLDNHLEGCAGGGGRAALAGNSTCMERLFKAAAGFLDEGSLDTRTHGKRIIWHVKGMLSGRAEFDRLLGGVNPDGLRRKVVDVVEGLNGPPPPPSRGVAGAANATIGSRLASRQLGTGATPASPVRPLLDQAAGSLTQPPPPPVRQGSYSAPQAPHSGATTPERRRLGRQRTSELVGIPEGGATSRQNSSNGRGYRFSAGAGSAGGGGGGPVGTGRLRNAASADGGAGSNGYTPVVQETVVKALQLLTAKDFRERMEALRSVEAVVADLPGAPDSLLVALLDALVARVGDANAKVSMAALELTAGLSAALRQRMSLGLNTLVPALAGALSSTNDKIRSLGITATDSLLGALDPAMLVQHFSHCVANGTLQRGKPLLVEKLVMIVERLHPSKPQLVARYAVPAAFALLNDGRGGEGKAAANALLTALARLMGPALMDQAGSLNAVAQQRVADAVAAATGLVVAHDGAGDAPPEPNNSRRANRWGAR
ncbi:hypothetical protein GPECTOR_50g640 [Gonium pectorale]|uniref:TOG domain-containing protein n=1 Tax=Gonium pectorale TaxID=33097 RepID=A0A150G7K4_GONPE|nr:hypothetical protein GPECTOR_50g640 [Gonium pectorale]|eukprot:KXZ45846.1 hypothetical protein GPECTOR_50g640 [Gonium pectorale]